ncbi:DNRLRE domain-containing protein [Streptomyces sp. VNUA24]|uniref:DNRLRE domain-containing protein n=1 Tax=Streptomyces sp. VNUA24 TaxID=3031131 RepID=UPI0023B7EBA4|nr:DNRLRE domain-containing protein [Streptomyces sp. VNUA24]WEH17185.1 DNRLRE domain-containing protein [Streptomyces sp. VNUA24]
MLAGFLALQLGVPAQPAGAVGTLDAPQAAPKPDSDDASIGAARIRAAVLGKRVEVPSLRTESSTVYVNPDGSVTEESTTGPIRVKDENGAWRNVDTTLVLRDGVVQPKQAASDIRISDGGSGPLAQVSEGSQSLGIGWDGELPKPVLKGNTATYQNVQPNADLVVSALPEGFSHLLVLRERPEEQVELRIPVAAEGLKLRETNDKRLLWEGKDGRDVATAPVPVMWGSEERAGSREPEDISDVAVTVEGSGDNQTLVLKPAKSFLDDPDVQYPVTVDPTSTLLGPITDTWVQDAAYPSSQRGSTELKAGTYDGTEKARSYLKFDTARFSGKRIIDADLRLYSYWSSSCSTANAGVQVRRVTADWDPSAITWSTQPSTTTAAAPVSKTAKGYSSNCPAGHVSWDVAGIVQAWADGQPNYGVRLAAVDETDPLTWRRYRSANYVDGSHDSATEPSLIVTYNAAPAVPTQLGITPRKTGTQLTIGSLTPMLQAGVNDSDAGSALITEFQVEPDPAHADTTYTWAGKTVEFTPGTVATTQIPTASALPDGTHLRVRSRTSDGIDTSAWSGWTTFLVDASAVRPADLPKQLQAGATDTASPLVTGVVSSLNGGMVEAQFRLGNASGTELLGSQFVPNGERVGFQIPADKLTSGGPFDWSMRACFEGKCSAWTAKTAISAGSGTPPAETAAATSVSVPLTKATVCTDAATCTGDTGTALKVGSVSGKNWRSYLKADLSNVPAGARITSATLQLQSSATTPDLAVHALNDAWTTGGTGADLDKVTAPGVNLDATAPWKIDVTGLVTGWADGANANHGLVLRRAEGASGTAGISFTSASLTVEYGAATAPSSPRDLRAQAGDQGALLTWTASQDSGYNDTHLTYEVTAVDSSGAVVATRTTSGTDAVITGLTNDAPYTFRVKATSPYGTSDSVTSNATTPLEAHLSTATYTATLNEYLEAVAALTTGAHDSASAATQGKPHAAKYSSLLKAEEFWLLDIREALEADDLTYTAMTSTLSDILVMPSADGSVAVRATVSEKRTLADSPEEPETNETAVLYTFSGEDAPVLDSKLNAQQFEQRLSKGDDAFGTVTYGSVESNISPTALTRQVPDSPAALGLDPAQYEAYASISRSGTANWAKKHWNDRHEYSQDCTNFVSKALYHGGGMRMKGVGKDNKSVHNWWRTKHSAPPHTGTGFYYRWSHTWTVADKMEHFLSLHSAGIVNTESKQSEAKIGDAVFFNWRGEGGWDHAGVVTKMKNGKAYVSAHNNNRLNQRLDVYIKSKRGTWANIHRVIPEWY